VAHGRIEESLTNRDWLGPYLRKGGNCVEEKHPGSTPGDPRKSRKRKPGIKTTKEKGDGKRVKFLTVTLRKREGDIWCPVGAPDTGILKQTLKGEKNRVLRIENRATHRRGGSQRSGICNAKKMRGMQKELRERDRGSHLKSFLLKMTRGKRGGTCFVHPL